MGYRRYRPPEVQAFLDRMTVPEVPDTAMVPRSLRPPTPDEAARGVVIAYANIHYTFYRAVTSRLRAGELFRMETRDGSYELTADQFARACPNVVASLSFSVGRESIPGSCFYSGTRRPPETVEVYRVQR